VLKPASQADIRSEPNAKLKAGTTRETEQCWSVMMADWEMADIRARPNGGDISRWSAAVFSAQKDGIADHRSGLGWSDTGHHEFGRQPLWTPGWLSAIVGC